MTRRLANKAVLAAHADKGLGCELAPFLACCGGHGLTQIHHVLRGPNRVDAAWNLVSVCGVAHDWCHRETVQGMVICWHVLHLRGDLNIDAIRQQWGRNPLQRIDQVARDACSSFRLVARKLLEVYGD